MYCAGKRVLSNSPALYSIASLPNFSASNHFYIENNLEMSGFYIRPNCGILLTIF